MLLFPEAKVPPPRSGSCHRCTLRLAMIASRRPIPVNLLPNRELRESKSNGREDALLEIPPKSMSNGREDFLVIPPKSMSNGREDFLVIPPKSMSNGREDLLEIPPKSMSNGREDLLESWPKFEKLPMSAFRSAMLWR